MSTGPFTVGEQGEPGSLTAYADFTCPKCGEQTRFLAKDQDEDGGFTCPHCGLIVEIRGTRLSDYQSQLDLINADVRRFTVDARQQLERATHKLLEKHELEKHEHPSPVAPKANESD